MTLILGLDVSTSCTGVCIIDSLVIPDNKGSHILFLDTIGFKGCVTLWDKADVVSAYLNGIQFGRGISRTAVQQTEDKAIAGIDRVVVEEPLMGFSAGLSSAQTITQLMRFNGIVSYIARNVFKVEPEYLGATHSRKLCGVKLQQKKKCGKGHKEQVFEHMSANDLKHVVWPTKKSGKVIDWAGDATDAYVIARAACLMNK